MSRVRGNGLAFFLVALTPAALTPSPPSLSESLAARFPALRARLDSPVRFDRTSWRHGGRTVAGLRAALPPTASSAVRATEAELRAASDSSVVPIDPVRVSFPSLASDPVVAEGDGVRVVLAPLGASRARAEVDGAAIAYRDAYRETDALQLAKPGSTEEYLHLRAPSAPRRFEYAILETEGAARVFVDNGQVRFVDGSGRGLVVLAPVVVDSAGRRSATAARWRLDDASSPRRLTLELDPDGLEYPLLVDPSWITTGSLATARLDPIGILLHNGKVLVMGNAASAEIYDPAAATWAPTGAGWAIAGVARRNPAAQRARPGLRRDQRPDLRELPQVRPRYECLDRRCQHDEPSRCVSLSRCSTTGACSRRAARRCSTRRWRAPRSTTPHSTAGPRQV